MFKLPREIITGVANYKEMLEEFLKGKMSSARFRGFRVPWGIYSHRKEIVYMQRVRLPGGGVSAKQLEVIADISEKYGNGMPHVTTRQDIQIHGVNIENTGLVLDYLKDYDLSSRGGGGNTVRNITACPLAGICPEEAFDVRSYVIGLSEFMLRDETSYNLPRKYKIAFSGCGKNCGLSTVNDLGFVAKKRSLNGKETPYFSVYVGGGMGAHSRIGDLLEESIDPSETGYVAEAVKRVFNKYGERHDRHRARLRFLIEKIGFEEFQRLYKEEIEKLKEEEYIFLRKIDLTYPSSTETVNLRYDDKEFNRWAKYNLKEQRQKGFYTIEIRLDLGDIESNRLRELALMASDFQGLEFRTSQNQNLLLCNVRAEDVHPVFEKLKTIDFAKPFASTALDVVCCAGATTCNLGLCNSRGAAREIIRTLEDSSLDLDILEDVQIKINGCPNACAQHPISPIGLHALSRKVNLRLVPFYRILIGGNPEEGRTSLSKDIGIVPARNLPLLLKEFLIKTQEEIGSYGDFFEFSEERGTEILKDLLDRYSYVPSYEEGPSFYKDWGREEDFSLAGIGPGECGAGVLDMIESDLEDASRALDRAKEDDYSLKEIKQSLHLSARALLVVKGIEPKSEKEAIEAFLDQFVKKGICSPRFLSLPESFESIEAKSEALNAKEIFIMAEELLEEVRSAYKSMDNQFNFQPRESYMKSVDQHTPAETYRVLDLKGVACPLNYVRAKVFLESVEEGEVIDIYLDEGEPIQNVPPSLENDGQKILSIEKKDGFFVVRVRKMA